MSGKQQKRLRKIAIGFAAALEQAGHSIDKVGYEEIGTKRVLKKGSLRSIIKSLKKRQA